MVSRGLPELPHPAGRGQLRLLRRPRRGGEHGRRARRERRSQQLRRRRVSSRDRGRRATSTTPASRSPRAPATTATASSTRPSSRYVTAVGGTSLTARLRQPAAGPRRAWSGAGSGCSRLRAPSRPGRPTPAARRRTVADVSAVADPNTGVAVYDSTVQGARLARLRRHQRVLADHRRRLRAGRQRGERRLRLVSRTRTPARPVRRRRAAPTAPARPTLPVHRAAPATTARPASARRTAPRASSSFSVLRVPARPRPSMLGWQRRRPMGRCVSAASP